MITVRFRHNDLIAQVEANEIRDEEGFFFFFNYGELQLIVNKLEVLLVYKEKDDKLFKD